MTTATSATASEALRDLAEEFWQAVLKAEPTWATILGDRRYDDRLDDNSPAGLEANRATLRVVAARARAIDTATLSPAERTTRSVLIQEAERQLSQFETGTERWTVDQLNGVPTFFMELPDYQPVGTPGEAEDMVARWRAMGPYMEQHIANLRSGLAKGEIAAADPVTRMIDILDGLLQQPVEEWSPWAIAAADRPDWSAADVERFRRELRTALEDIVKPAFDAYWHLLQHEILPKARSAEQPGIMHVPGGAEAYRKLIRVHTTLDLSAEEIHETGLREMARIDAEFAELGQRVLGTPDREATLARLKNDPALRFSTSAEVQATAERSLAKAQAALSDWFGRTCKALCEVVPIPAHAAEHNTLAYYSWPALDGSRPGRFWINLHAPETRPRYDAEALAFHEAVPGPTSSSRWPRSSRACRRFSAISARPRTPRAGASTPSA